MSDGEKLAQIAKLQGIIGQLSGLMGSVEALDFTQFKEGGTNMWAGQVKSGKYNPKYDEGKSQLAKTAPEIEEAIADCQSKIQALIMSLEDPTTRMQFW
ncbi:hypothetical protein OfM1_20570 [Lactovum odontotermitis]